MRHALHRKGQRFVILASRHKTYYTFDDVDSATVFVSTDGKMTTPLRLRLDIVNHSPTGLACGFGKARGISLTDLGMVQSDSAADWHARHPSCRRRWPFPFGPVRLAASKRSIPAPEPITSTVLPA